MLEHSPLGASSAEQWKMHPTLPLAASSLGRVKYIYGRASVCKPRPDKDGYHIITYGPRGKQRTVRVHRIVCAAWEGYESDLEVDHGDRDRKNNKPGNLKYTSIPENRQNTSVRKDSSTGVK